MNQEGHFEGIIAKDGYPFIISSLILGVVIWIILHLKAAIPFFLLTGWVAWFFRNPERTIPDGEGLVVSPADGKVVLIEKVRENQFLKKERVRVSVFMSVFNVHVNRSPIKGMIKKVTYHPGKFAVAFKDKASELNEKNSILVEDEQGCSIVVEQIAGLVARRIVFRMDEGQEVERGERFGMIRFGSRVDTYLPLDAALKISVGSRVKGGGTILGVLP